MTTTASSSTPARTANTPLSIALIGAGGIAKAHLAAAKEQGDAMVVTAVADRDANAAQTVADSLDATSFDDAGVMLDRIATGEIKADAVILCTPPNHRVEPITRAVELGLHVLVEKPLASNPEDAAALEALAAQNPNLCLAVGYCHRFVPALNEMKARMDSGALGQITRFENVFAFHHPPMAERWFSDPKVSGGGSFIDTGCHSLDIFRYLVGPAESVGAVLSSPWAGRGDAEASVLVRSVAGRHAGAAGVILSGWLEPARFQVRVVGTEGSLSYDYDHPEALVHTNAAGTVETVKVVTHETRFARQLDAFATASRAGTSAESVGLASFADGAAAARVVAAATKG